MASAYNFKKLFVLTGLCITLSGCLLTDDRKRSLIDRYNQKSELTKIEQEREKQNAEKGELPQKYSMQEIEDSIEDYKALRPSITRLIEIESDLAYVTSFLRNKERNISLADSPLTNKVSSGGLPELSDVMEAQGDKQFISEQKSLMAPIQNNSTESEVLVGVAAPPGISSPKNVADKFSVLAPNSSTALAVASPTMSEASFSMSDIQRLDSKFKQTGDTNGSTRGSTSLSNDEMKASYSNVIRGATSASVRTSDASASVLDEQAEMDAKFKTAATDSCWKAENGGRYSVHLASYSNQTSAQSGYERIVNKHNDTLCAFTPKVASVEVKGVQYLSLRLGPIATKQEAQQVCSYIKASGDYCTSAIYEGVSL